MRQINIVEYYNGRTSVQTDDKKLMLLVLKYFRKSELKKIEDRASNEVQEIDDQITNIEKEIEDEKNK